MKVERKGSVTQPVNEFSYNGLNWCIKIKEANGHRDFPTTEYAQDTTRWVYYTASWQAAYEEKALPRRWDAAERARFGGVNRKGCCVDALLDRVEMKRLIAGVLGGLVCVGVAACGGERRSGLEDGATLAMRTTTPRMRVDGGVQKRHARIVEEASRGGCGAAFVGASIVERWETVGASSWSRVWKPRGAVDCGIGGDRTEDVLWRLDNGLLGALGARDNRVEWVVVNIGGNNLESDSAEEIAAGIEAVVARIRRGLPEARVVVTGVLPVGRRRNALWEKARAVNGLVAAYFGSREGGRVVVVDSTARFVGADGELAAELMPDFQHPSAKGYEVWTEELEAVVGAKR